MPHKPKTKFKIITRGVTRKILGVNQKIAKTSTADWSVLKFPTSIHGFYGLGWTFSCEAGRNQTNCNPKLLFIEDFVTEKVTSF